MRVIKFRALIDDMFKSKFAYGQLTYSQDSTPIIVFPLPHIFTRRTCIKGTEGQFIGFVDKNKREIYEGDIIRYDFESDGEMESSFMQIFFNESTAQFCYDGSYKSDKTSFQELNQEFCSEIEVVGNIHLNADLLKVEMED